MWNDSGTFFKGPFVECVCKKEPDKFKKRTHPRRKVFISYPTTLHTPTRRSSQMKSSMKRSNPLSDSDAELGKKRIRVARPPNSFLLFSNATRSALKRQNPHLNNAQLAKLLGTTWKTLHPDEKKRFTERADRIKTNYFKINPIPITEDADTIQPESVRPQSALELLEAALHTGPSPPEPDYQETLDFIEGYMTERKITGYSEEDIDSFTTVSSTLTPNTSLPSTPSSQFSLGDDLSDHDPHTSTIEDISTPYESTEEPYDFIESLLLDSEFYSEGDNDQNVISWELRYENCRFIEEKTEWTDILAM